MERRIIIVGNSSGVLDKKLGSEIDKFTYVLRFNDFVINGYENYVGTKTTHVWLSLPFSYRISELDKRIRVITHSRYVSHFSKCKNLELIDSYSGKNKKNKKWSSGIHVIHHLLKNNFKVTTYGITDGQNSHYWDLNFKVWKMHDLEEDFRILSEWEISRLN